MKPNILHIFTDQQRFDTISALGNSSIKTPNIDRLVRSGVAFTNAYTPSPVCVAARCSMIYGQYPVNTHCWANDNMPEDGRESFIDALTKTGYRTHGIGKCHFTPDAHAKRGFETRKQQEELDFKDLSLEPYYKMLVDNGYAYASEAHGVRGEMYYIPQPSRLPEHLHPTAWIGDRSVEFLRQQDKNRPWYLFTSFIHPHPPFSPPAPWHRLYRAPMMPLPNVPQDTENLQMFVNKVQNRYKYRDTNIDINLVRCMKAYYYACISFIDFQIGRILDELEQTGQLENTLILFTTDHGEHLGDYNCFGKRSMHDTAAKIPFILSMPGLFDGGKTCDIPVSLVDIAPTFTALAGSEIESHVTDGVDLAKLMPGEIEREYVFSQYSCYKDASYANANNIPKEYYEDELLWRSAMSDVMVVSKEWKYIHSAADGKEYLFDKKTDLYETRNKAGLSFYKKHLEKMKHNIISYLELCDEVNMIKDGEWIKFPEIKLPSDPDSGLLTQDIDVPWFDIKIQGYSEDT